MGLQLKATLNLCVLASALLLTACGKKDNKVGGSVYSGSSPFTTGVDSLNNSTGSTISNQVNTIKANLACARGYRLSNDVSFYATSGQMIRGTTLNVQNWQQGFMNSGSINKLWIGVSAFKDLMFVTQVTNGGSQVVGYNVTFSFCSQEPFLTNTRTYPALQAQQIVLDQDTYCGFGGVDAAYTMVGVAASHPYPAASFPTTFSKPGCNGRY